MPQNELNVSCEGLIFRVFQHPRAKIEGSIVALTSPHRGAGVTRIANALVEALRYDGHPSAVNISARELSARETGTSTQTNLSNALDRIRRESRCALIDCGSMNSSQSAIRLAPLVDGIILIVEANRTTTQQIRYAERAIESVNGRILGHVLNKRTYVVPNWLHRMIHTAGI